MSDLSRNFPQDAIETQISISRRLRVLLPEIEKLAQKGVPRKVILEYLNDNGFNLNMATYATLLQRLRKEVKKKGRVVLANEEKINTPITDGYVSRTPIVLGQRAKKFEVNPFPSENWSKAKKNDNE